MDAFADSGNTFVSSGPNVFTVGFTKDVFIKQYTFKIQGPSLTYVSTDVNDSFQHVRANIFMFLNI